MRKDEHFGWNYTRIMKIYWNGQAKRTYCDATKMSIYIFLTLILMSFSATIIAQTSNAKTVVISIDGTNNDPSDATIRYDKEGVVKDESISNVFKLHLFAGGFIDNEEVDAEAPQIALYYMGVGNRQKDTILGRFRSKLSAAIAIFEPSEIEAEVNKDLAKHCNPCDNLYIFGFSRGAATARKIAQRIATKGITIENETHMPKIKFLGVWDTVAAFGARQELLDPNKYPSSEVLGEIDNQIASEIDKAYHLVSIDDPRLAFRPTLMGWDDVDELDHESARVQEIWFSGVHSDVGGGYEDDGLSDVTLNFMINRATEVEGLSIRTLDDISADSRIDIGMDRLEIAPEFIDNKTHLKILVDDKGLAPEILELLHERDLLAKVGNTSNSRKPVLHHSVITRINSSDTDYAPSSVMKLGESYLTEHRD